MDQSVDVFAPMEEQVILHWVDAALWSICSTARSMGTDVTA
jgi:ribosomal protein L11